MGFLEWAGGVAQDVGNAVSEGAGQAYDAGADLFGYNSRADNAQQMGAAVSQATNEKLREQLAAQNGSLASGMEFDPASITQQENWQSYSHQELYDTNQRSLDQGKATEVAHQWREIAAKLKEVGPRLQQNAGSAIASGWEGEAADAANRSAEPLVNWMSSSSEAFLLTGNKIEEAASAAGQVKAMVPEPEGHHYGRTFVAAIPTGIGAPIDAMAQMQERQQAERAAQETMGRVLSPTYSNVDTTVPAYRDLNDKPAPPPTPPPLPPIPPPPPPVRPNGRTGTGTDQNTTSVPPLGDISGRGPNDPAGTSSAWTPSSNPARLPGDLPGTGPGIGRGSGDPGLAYMPGPGMGRTGPGVPSPGTGRSGPGGPGGAGGGKPPGLGAGGAGRLGAGAGALGAGGRAGVGGLGAAGGAAGGVAGAGAAGGAAGRGGMGAGGMGGAGQRGQGSEDQEHERPGWLEEPDDVWLEGMPKTAPPVFGA